MGYDKRDGASGNEMKASMPRDVILSISSTSNVTGESASGSSAPKKRGSPR